MIATYGQDLGLFLATLITCCYACTKLQFVGTQCRENVARAINAYMQLAGRYMSLFPSAYCIGNCFEATTNQSLSFTPEGFNYRLKTEGWKEVGIKLPRHKK